MRKLAVFVCFFAFGCANLKSAPIHTCVCKADEEAKSFAAKLKQNSESIVLVIVKDASGKAVGAGTGWVYDKNGIIFTARHVISSIPVVSAEITFYEEGRIFVKKASWHNSAIHDLSILKVDHKFKNQLSVRTADLQSGENLYALGFPLVSMPESGKKYPLTQSYGKFYMFVPLILRFGQVFYMDTMQASTIFASPGFSGAPIFDKDGNTVGVLTNNKPIQDIPARSVFTWSVQAKYFREVMEEFSIK
jgi:S1-C subfamily serine protease